MHQLTFSSAVKALALLCPFFLMPAATFADPPHLLKDKPALSAVPPVAFAKKPLFILNDHLERIPKSYTIYGLRSGVSGKLVCTDRLGNPTLSFPMPRAFLCNPAMRPINLPKAAAASFPGTK